MDMETLMAQASALQNKVTAAQERLASMHVKGVTDNGAVIVDMTGKYDLAGIQISDELASRGGAAVSDAVARAYMDAKAKADELIDRVMGDATAGVPLPE